MATVARAYKPYPPSVPSFVDTSGGGGGLLINWRNRNRTKNTLSKQTDATETLEAGQTTQIRIYKIDNTLIHTESSLTGTDWTYDDATEIADAGSIQDRLIVKVRAQRAGYSSVDREILVNRIDQVYQNADRVIDGANIVID